MNCLELILELVAQGKQSHRSKEYSAHEFEICEAVVKFGIILLETISLLINVFAIEN